MGHWELLEAASRMRVPVMLSGHGRDECGTAHGNHAVREAYERRAWGVLARGFPGRWPKRGQRVAKVRLRGPTRLPERISRMPGGSRSWCVGDARR